MYKNCLKRCVDCLLAICVLFIVWPFLLIVIIFLYFANKGAGVFFTQERPGRNAKIFRVIKFKTMTDERDKDGKLLKGDMEFVGPRPLLPKYLPLYSKEQFRRHEVRPGITGWAQINGRNNISWTKKFEYDVWYVDHLSLGLDLKILLLTVKKFFVREGISKEGEATTVPFDGTN